MLKEFKALIENGSEELATLAEQVSDCDTAKHGGDLGWFAANCAPLRRPSQPAVPPPNARRDRRRVEDFWRGALAGAAGATALGLALVLAARVRAAA